MCIPVFAAALLAGAGGVAKYIGEKKAAKAQARASENERVRQREMTERQQQLVNRSTDAAGNMADPSAIAAAKNDREGQLFAAMQGADGPTNFLPGQAGAPTVVQQQSGKAVERSQEQARTLASAMAALGGTTDQMQGLGIQLGRNSQQMGQIARDKMNSAGILPAELEAAAHKGSLLRGLGGLAMQIGLSSLTGGAGEGVAKEGIMAGRTKSMFPAGIY